MRQIARDLRPVNFDTEGLFTSLETLCQNFAQRTSLEVHGNIGGEEPALSGETRIGLYRFVQEALTNVVKHAEARRERCDSR
jgi:signal transduction histidine kinase